MPDAGRSKCKFRPVSVAYYKLNKGFFPGFLFKPLGGLCPPRGLNRKASEKNPLSITYPADKTYQIIRIFFLTGLNPHATELIFTTPFLANKMELFGT